MEPIGVLVVARWNEDTDWIARHLPLGWTARVVQKDRDLPNVGREASSFFWFMATQDIDPALTYAFVQGNPFPHAFEVGQLRAVDAYTPLGGHTLNEDHEGHPNHSGLPTGRTFREWFGGEPPRRFIAPAGAQFLVPGRVILSRPRTWYAEMQERVSTHGSGPWIMERLWPHVWTARSEQRSEQTPPPPVPAPTPALPAAYAGLDLLAAIHRGDPYAGAPTVPLDTQGWNEDLSVFDRVLLEVRPSLVVEVGSWKGQSAAAMGKRLQGWGGKLVCVDTWLGSLEMIDCPHRSVWLDRRHGMPSIYFTFLSNMLQLGLRDTVVPFPQTSTTAARWMTKHGVRPDLVYIDASHEEDDVWDDLVAWWSTLRPGGTLFGDDYSAHWPGVVAAVDRFARVHRLPVRHLGETWIVRKPS